MEHRQAMGLHLLARGGKSRKQAGDQLLPALEIADAGMEQPLDAAVQGLDALGDELGGTRQAAAESFEAQPRLIRHAAHRARQTRAVLHDIGQQLGAHRHRHLGGGRGRRRPPVGGMIDQGRVGLMADGGDQRDAARRGGPHDDLLIEGPEILQAAAAPGDDQEIGPRQAPAREHGVEPGDGGGDLILRPLALDQHRPDQHPAREAVGQAMQDVADHRPGRAR